MIAARIAILAAALALAAPASAQNPDKPTPESAASQKASVHEGEQKGYDETEICGAPGPLAGTKALNPKWIAVEAGSGAAILCALLCRGSGGSKNNNMSQSSP